MSHARFICAGATVVLVGLGFLARPMAADHHEMVAETEAPDAVGAAPEVYTFRRSASQW